MAWKFDDPYRSHAHFPLIVSMEDLLALEVVQMVNLLTIPPGGLHKNVYLRLLI